MSEKRTVEELARLTGKAKSEFLSGTEAAKRAGIDAGTLYNYNKKENGPPFYKTSKHGPGKWYPLDQLKLWIAWRETGVRPSGLLKGVLIDWPEPTVELNVRVIMDRIWKWRADSLRRSWISVFNKTDHLDPDEVKIVRYAAATGMLEDGRLENRARTKLLDIARSANQPLTTDHQDFPKLLSYMVHQHAEMYHQVARWKAGHLNEFSG